MMAKKTQSEIIGLAMIVLILIFGLLIYISFSMKGDDEVLTKEFTYKQIPVLLNNAILETHTLENECHGEKMQKLIMKMAEGSSLTCNDGTLIEDFVDEKIEFFLNSTLDDWHMTYRYTIYTGTDYTDESTYVLFKTNSASECWNMDIHTENFFFRMSNGNLLNIKLDLCS